MPNTLYQCISIVHLMYQNMKNRGKKINVKQNTCHTNEKKSNMKIKNYTNFELFHYKKIII